MNLSRRHRRPVERFPERRVDYQFAAIDAVDTCTANADNDDENIDENNATTNVYGDDVDDDGSDRVGTCDRTTRRSACDARKFSERCCCGGGAVATTRDSLVVRVVVVVAAAVAVVVVDDGGAAADLVTNTAVVEKIDSNDENESRRD